MEVEFDFQSVPADGAVDAMDVEEPVDPYAIDMGKSLYLSGPHHVLHNLQEGLAEVMIAYVWFIELLKHLCKLLTNRWSKERLLRSCFTSGPSTMFYESIRKFQRKVYEKRWGTAAAAVNDILNLHQALQRFWNVGRFKAGREMQYDPNNDSHSANVAVANEAIRSPVFWAYSIMMDLVSWLILTCSSWIDSCPCHWSLPTAFAISSQARRAYWLQRQQMDKCIMSCRRCPELAAGALFDLVNRLLGVMQNALLSELQSIYGLSDEDIAKVMLDFTSARRHIWLTIQIKLSFWLRLPWHLLGLGYHRLDVARQICRRCLELRAEGIALEDLQSGKHLYRPYH